MLPVILLLKLGSHWQVADAKNTKQIFNVTVCLCKNYTSRWLRKASWTLTKNGKLEEINTLNSCSYPVCLEDLLVLASLFIVILKSWGATSVFPQVRASITAWCKNTYCSCTIEIKWKALVRKAVFRHRQSQCHCLLVLVIDNFLCLLKT